MSLPVDYLRAAADICYVNIFFMLGEGNKMDWGEERKETLCICPFLTLRVSWLTTVLNGLLFKLGLLPFFYYLGDGKLQKVH